MEYLFVFLEDCARIVQSQKLLQQPCHPVVSESLNATQQSGHSDAGHHSDTQMFQTLGLRCNYLIKGLGQYTEPTCTPTAGMIQRPEDPQLFINNEKPPEPWRETTADCSTNTGEVHYCLFCVTALQENLESLLTNIQQRQFETNWITNKPSQPKRA